MQAENTHAMTDWIGLGRDRYGRKRLGEGSEGLGNARPRTMKVVATTCRQDTEGMPLLAAVLAVAPVAWAIGAALTITFATVIVLVFVVKLTMLSIALAPPAIAIVLLLLPLLGP